MPRQGGRP
uniref:Uncharacterized protein n=1 Tax=Anguilla anguilla TaxID=7936 RepID=A0A0E9TDB5_ANGAN